MISYTATAIIVTDDDNPTRGPMVLPAGSTPSQVEAAVLAYLGPPEPAPDWDQFRLALRQENGYAPAFQQAMLADPMAGIQLAIGLNTFRSNGDFSDFLGALVAALSTLPAEQREHVAADLMVLSSRCNLPGAFIEAMQVLIANAAGNSSS